MVCGICGADIYASFKFDGTELCIDCVKAKNISSVGKGKTDPFFVLCRKLLKTRTKYKNSDFEFVVAVDRYGLRFYTDSRVLIMENVVCSDDLDFINLSNLKSNTSGINYPDVNRVAGFVENNDSYIEVPYGFYNHLKMLNIRSRDKYFVDIDDSGFHVVSKNESGKEKVLDFNFGNSYVRTEIRLDAFMINTLKPGRITWCNNNYLCRFENIMEKWAEKVRLCVVARAV